jgi:hypothetical protein
VLHREDLHDKEVIAADGKTPLKTAATLMSLWFS